MATATPPDLDLRTRLFIDGRFVDATGGGRFTSENPATGQPLADIAEGDAADVDVAVRAARQAVEHGPWSTLAPAERKRVLFAVADAIDANVEELARIESLDAGKPIEDCRTIDIPETANTIRWHAEAIDKLNDDVTPTGKDALAMIVREPVGVVGAVIPWNYPALMAAWKLGPALATGNAVVIKPASYTALSLLRIAELATEAGLPPGVLNVVTGGGSTVGQAIGRHPDIDAVAFTGSTEVGRDFLHYAAESNLKRVMLELGGKSPQVVMADVGDLDNLVANAARTRSSGTWARTARPARGSSSTSRAATRSSIGSSPTSSGSGSSATRWTRPRASARSSPRATSSASSTTSRPAARRAPGS